ncbi:MAG: FAD-dependent oxidoreductase [Woeseiaceae bacterium]|nr:FAD-dependent oxidoreductase [Woeseiaceae bacterium]
MSEQRIFIVGAGQAAVRAAEGMRKRGFDGRIVMLGDEAYPPYQRPPLSKAFLKGQLEENRLAFKADAWYEGQAIDLRVSARVERIDTAARELIAGEERLAYDKLILATGSRPLQLPIPGADLNGVLELRGIDDAKAIKTRLEGLDRLIVVGGGYIGLEVAAAARQMGRSVTVIERLPRLLSRVTSPEISSFFLDLHRGHGVDIRLEDSVERIEGDGSVSAVQLSSGERIDADAVLIGIGVRPNQELAEGAGIACDDGILVDDHGATSADGVYAAGDCTRREIDGASVRLESVHNALDQADRIAAHIVSGEDLPFDPPWFWSDQYDVKLQAVGLFNGYDDIRLIGDVGASRFSALYFRGGTLLAVDSVNDPATFMSAKTLMKLGVTVTASEIEQSGDNLRDILKQARDAARSDS